MKRPWNKEAPGTPWKPKSSKFGNSRFDGAFYNSKEWKQFRKWIEGQRPKVCIMCGRDAYYLDHIIPISQGGKRLNPDNVQWLCVRCHAAKTNKERAENKK